MVAVALVMSAGCSSNSSASNNGGDTSCADFAAMDSSGKKAVIEKYLEDKGEKAGAVNVQLTKASAEMFCRTSGETKRVRDIETG